MNRRGFLGFLASLPFIGKLAPEEWTYSYAMPSERIEAKIIYQVPGVIEFRGRTITGLCSTPGHLVVTFENGKHVEVTGDSVFNFRVKNLD